VPDVGVIVVGAGNAARAAAAPAQYPGGTGLMSGAVFGRIAGHSAATVSRG
jgi:hypothetical protein